MKLIIDIEPRYCKDMHSEVKAPYYEAINRITEAVSNGIPYEERPQGEWVFIGNSEFTQLSVYECSSCYRRSYGSLEYCGRCGAKMRGKKNDVIL